MAADELRPLPAVRLAGTSCSAARAGAGGLAAPEPGRELPAARAAAPGRVSGGEGGCPVPVWGTKGGLLCGGSFHSCLGSS